MPSPPFASGSTKGVISLLITNVKLGIVSRKASFVCDILRNPKVLPVTRVVRASKSCEMRKIRTGVHRRCATTCWSTTSVCPNLRCGDHGNSSSTSNCACCVSIRYSSSSTAAHCRSCQESRSKLKSRGFSPLAAIDSALATDISAFSSFIGVSFAVS